MTTKWYYGPGHQDVLHVFKAADEPTEQSHGKFVQYAVGPFKTLHASVTAAHKSKAHPGWRVFRKVKGPYSVEV